MITLFVISIIIAAVVSIGDLQCCMLEIIILLSIWSAEMSWMANGLCI